MSSGIFGHAPRRRQLDVRKLLLVILVCLIVFGSCAGLSAAITCAVIG